MTFHEDEEQDEVKAVTHTASARFIIHFSFPKNETTTDTEDSRLIMTTVTSPQFDKQRMCSIDPNLNHALT